MINFKDFRTFAKKTSRFFLQVFLWVHKNNGIIGIFIAVFSLWIGFRSLKISEETSIRDSQTSIQMEKNRKNDSILSHNNNLRDSIQQKEIVELLEKYNKIADKLLDNQIQADRPIINLGIIKYDDSIKEVFSENGINYFMPIINYVVENKGKRDAFDLTISFKYFFPEINSVFENNKRSMGNTVGFDTNVKPMDCPVIPVSCRNKFHFKVSLTWEDRFIVDKKYSKDEYITIVKYTNGQTLVANAVASEIEEIKKLERKGSHIKISPIKISDYLNRYYYYSQFSY